jgi:hypothetical protein
VDYKTDDAARRSRGRGRLVNQPLCVQKTARAAGHALDLDAQAGDGLTYRVVGVVLDEQDAPLRASVLKHKGHQPLQLRGQFRLIHHRNCGPEQRAEVMGRCWGML